MRGRHDASPFDRPRILVFHGDGGLGESLARTLSAAGLALEVVTDHPSAFERARRDRFELIVLDAGQPGSSGESLCRAIRMVGVNTHVPILMVARGASDLDISLGLEGGADDYLAEPFGDRELLKRVGDLLRSRRRRAGQARTTG
jgi:DNA-binding response OmpR family regulator